METFNVSLWPWGEQGLLSLWESLFFTRPPAIHSNMSLPWSKAFAHVTSWALGSRILHCMSALTSGATAKELHARHTLMLSVWGTDRRSWSSMWLFIPFWWNNNWITIIGTAHMIEVLWLVGIGWSGETGWKDQERAVVSVKELLRFIKLLYGSPLADFDYPEIHWKGTTTVLEFFGGVWHRAWGTGLYSTVVRLAKTSDAHLHLLLLKKEKLDMDVKTSISLGCCPTVK